MSKKVAILQSNYIPWKGYFDLINQVDEFIIYDDMQYTRRDWRNRNIIKTAQGLKWLSIPVEVKGKYFQKINETKVADKSWYVEHWNSLSINYAKAPYFKEMAPLIEDLYFSASYNLLSEVNYHFIIHINKLLNIKTKISWSSEYSLIDGKTERLLDLCKQAGAAEYISGPAAKNYLDENLFKAENINVNWMDYSKYKEYPQLYPPFEHGVTIIDMIFNLGKEVENFLK